MSRRPVIAPRATRAVEAHHGSSFLLARLMEPTFIVIAFGMLIDLGMYESMNAEPRR
jgi:hypothetical protein